MKIELGKRNTIELFSSIDELKIDRFNQFNRYVMLDAELGGTIHDYDRNIHKVLKFMEKEMLKEAVQSMENLRLTYWNILQSNNPTHYSFAILVKSINGKETKDDFSKEYLDEIIKQMTSLGITQKTLTESIQTLKKK